MGVERCAALASALGGGALPLADATVPLSDDGPV